MKTSSKAVIAYKAVICDYQDFFHINCFFNVSAQSRDGWVGNGRQQTASVETIRLQEKVQYNIIYDNIEWHRVPYLMFLTLTLQNLIFSGYPTVFIAILGQALLKLDSSPI